VFATICLHESIYLYSSQDSKSRTRPKAGLPCLSACIRPLPPTQFPILRRQHVSIYAACGLTSLEPYLDWSPCGMMLRSWANGKLTGEWK
jgi:hypothetical protein